MKTHRLNLTPLEAGILRGILEKHDEVDSLPKSLKVKMDILFCQHYLDHPTLGKQARREISSYRKELKRLEVQNG